MPYLVAENHEKLFCFAAERRSVLSRLTRAPSTTALRVRGRFLYLLAPSTTALRVRGRSLYLLAPSTTALRVRGRFLYLLAPSTTALRVRGRFLYLLVASHVSQDTVIASPEEEKKAGEGRKYVNAVQKKGVIVLYCMGDHT